MLIKQNECIDDIFMIQQYGEHQLIEFLKLLNECHPTIKFTYEYSREKINFLDVQIIKQGQKLVTDLYIKPTDTHQYLDASSCHPFHCKRSIPYSQALRLNRICSETEFLDSRCNELESWLIDRGYSKHLVRQQILKARKPNRDNLLDKGPKPASERKLVFNITYRPSFSKVKDILSNIHLLLACNAEHGKVFPQVPIVGFKKGKSLKDILVSAKVREGPPTGLCQGCGSKRCGVCKCLANTTTFTNRDASKTFNINGTHNCNSEYVVYLLQCKTCKIQYVGSSVDFRSRFNNYKTFYRKHNEGKKRCQAFLFDHYNSEGHNGFEDFEFFLIDHIPDYDDDALRQREAFWQYKLNTFKPLGLNTREVKYKFS